MKKAILTLALALSFVGCASAQLLINNLSIDPTANDQAYTPTGTFSSAVSWSAGVLAVGAGADQSGYYLGSIQNSGGGVSFDGSGLTQLTITFEINSGNAPAGGFNVSLSDGTLAPALAATFSTSGLNTGQWYTETATVSSQGLAGSISDLQYWSIAGNGSNTPFRMSFKNNVTLSPTAVPEPSTYAGLLGFAALGLVYFRRRKQAA